MWPKNSQTVTRISHPLFPRSLGPFTVKLFTLYAIRNNAHAFPRYIDVDQRTGAHDASMRRRAALPARELRSSADFERCSGDARRGGDLGAFGNAVATASFQTLADSLVTDSVTELQHNATAWPVFDVTASAVFYPFRYSDDDWIDLGSLTIQQYPDPAGSPSRSAPTSLPRGANRSVSKNLLHILAIQLIPSRHRIGFKM